MKPLLRNFLIVGGILGLTFVAALLVTGGRRAVQQSPVPSSYNSSACGFKAGYTTLEKLQQPVERWEHPWTKLGPRTGILIFSTATLDVLNDANKTIMPSDEECQALAHWISRGNTSVLMASPWTAQSRELEPLIAKLLGSESTTNTERESKHQSTPPAVNILDPPTRESTTLRSIMPVTFTRGVKTLNVARTGGYPLTNGVQIAVVAGPGQTTELAWAPYQHGQVLIFSTASFFDNEFLPQADNLLLLLNILHEFRGAGDILFDEFHHGYSSEFATRDFLALPVVRFAAMQLALLVGLIIWSQWRRFGEPVPLRRETRRSVMEYTVSLGDLYARAQSQIETLDYLYNHLRRELIDRHGLRAQATATDIAGRLDDRSVARQTWVQLANDCERHLTGRALTRQQFAQLARRIQEFRRLLR